jgi:hypothetical protein
MSENMGCAVAFLTVLGLAFVYGGLLFHLGRWRSWYLTPDTIFGARPALYGFVPMGLAFLSLVVTLLLPTLEARRTAGAYIIAPLGVLAVILLFWHPKWLKPKWVSWLEENNQDILDLIVEEGRKTQDWGKVVATQAGLEAWVAEIRRKHDLPAAATSVATAQSKGWLQRNWPVGLVIVAASSGMGQYFLGSGFIGFVAGWGILGLIYLAQSEARKS